MSFQEACEPPTGFCIDSESLKLNNISTEETDEGDEGDRGEEGGEVASAVEGTKLMAVGGRVISSCEGHSCVSSGQLVFPVFSDTDPRSSTDCWCKDSSTLMLGMPSAVDSAKLSPDSQAMSEDY